MLHRLAGPAAATAVMAAACFASDFIDAERQLHARFGDDLHAAAPEAVSAAIVEMAESLPEFGAIDLPRCVPSGRLDFRSVADHLQITGGRDGEVILGGGQRGIQMLFSRLDLTIDRGAAVRPTPFELALAAGGRPADPDPTPPPRPRRVLRFENAAPASDLVALFCSGGIHIRNDIERCAWIAGDNAFGSRVVTADARVDDSLFLWFGLNWPFQDYNAHWDPKQADRDWSARPQMEFDCHGGGGGTRLYMMIETNYGNPAPGVVLRNVEGMALYHGSTERSSAQGPGTYWLKDCRRV